MANVTAAVRHSTQYDVGSIMGCLQGSSTSDCGKLETGGNGFHVATYFFIEFLKFKIQFGTTTCPFDTFPGSRMRNCFCEKGGDPDILSGCWKLMVLGLILQNLHLTKEPSVVSCVLGSKI